MVGKVAVGRRGGREGWGLVIHGRESVACIDVVG